LTHSREIAFHIRHENRDTARAEIFRERLQRHCLASASRAGDEPVAIRHLQKQFNRIFARFGDDDGFTHTLRVLSEGPALSSKRATACLYTPPSFGSHN